MLEVVAFDVDELDVLLGEALLALALHHDLLEDLALLLHGRAAEHIELDHEEHEIADDREQCGGRCLEPRPADPGVEDVRDEQGEHDEREHEGIAHIGIMVPGRTLHDSQIDGNRNEKRYGEFESAERFALERKAREVDLDAPDIVDEVLRGIPCSSVEERLPLRALECQMDGCNRCEEDDRRGERDDPTRTDDAVEDMRVEQDDIRDDCSDAARDGDTTLQHGQAEEQLAGEQDVAEGLYVRPELRHFSYQGVW